MKPFVPHDLPITSLDYSQLIGLVGQANAAIARYDGMLQSVVNPTILLSPLTTNEAVLSSKIEGTQATLDEVLEHEAGQSYDEEKTKDIQEIVNYRLALTLASETLEERPLTLSLLQHIHGILLNSVRGQHKSPGEFRKDQNWIGPSGCTQEEATFVPPGPLQLTDHLQAWEAYVQADDIDGLIQTAVVHAQFELIHPFKDGNGRIGRLLIPLFLQRKQLLNSPTFYLSEYLEENRQTYYDLLLGISQREEWNAWIKFFLTAIVEQAKRNTEKVQLTLQLYEQMKAEIADATHSQHAIHLLDAIFDRPVFQTSDMVKRTNLPKQTVMPLLRKLKDAGTLATIREASGRRPAILAFPKLLSITEGKKLRL
ncbi:MAG: Fic family protein [Planctomycetes bacterium]|nr:Fic family protein [Planctomycetota bacterium]